MPVRIADLQLLYGTAGAGGKTLIRLNSGSKTVEVWECPER
jgi:hypothetical protein